MMISLPQFDWRAILGISKKICGKNFVLCHKPIWQFNKKSEKMHMSMIYQSFRAILQTTYNPWFEIRNLLNQLKNESWSLLWHHERLHQICQNVVVLIFQFFWQIPKATITVLMCMTNHKESQLNLLKHFICGQQRKKC